MGIKLLLWEGLLATMAMLGVEAIGFSAGIWLYWKSHDVSISILANTSQHLTVQISKCKEDLWVFSAVYGSSNPMLRASLHEDVSNLAPTIGQPWLLVGDFNDMVSLEERHGGGPGMQRHCDILNTGLKIMPSLT